MKVYKDINACKAKILASIRAYGNLAEHNYYNYLYNQTAKKKCVFFDFGNKKGLMAFYNKETKIWYEINGILSPQNEIIRIFKEFIKYALFKDKAKKVKTEMQEHLKDQLLQSIKDTEYKLTFNYFLHWPVYGLDRWDENLGGGQWKKLRNIRNRFQKLDLEITDPRKERIETLRTLLSTWLRRRHPRDRVEFGYYQNLIENKFEGIEIVRGLSIDGDLCSVSAGWKIPNSNDFYCGIGIFNYKYKDLGDFTNIEDLNFVKKLGYGNVDLGGSDEAILNFKSKFRPESIYRTCIFHISTKKHGT